MFENMINNWFGAIVFIISAMSILSFATGKLEDELSILGKKMRIPGSIRGATLDAISSSIPEFLTAMIGLIILKEKGLEVGIGTISGSAIFNILIIPFCSLLIYKGSNIIKVSKSGIKRDVFFYILSIIILLIGLFLGKLLIMGFSLISLYIGYLIFLYYETKKDRKQNKVDIMIAYFSVENKKVSYITIIYTLILICIGVNGAIHAAEFIGQSLQIPIIIVALILLAGITSIPDTLLSIKASKKGDIDASLSNAVGSNIFDICIGLGLPVIIGVGFMGLDPIIDFYFNLPIFIFLIASVFVYLAVLLSKRITKHSGYYLLFMYIVFMWFIIYII